MMIGTDLLSAGGESAAWIGLLGEAAAKGTLLLLASILISGALRRAPAATRHMVWASCLALLLALPLLAQITPAVPAPVIPASWSAAWNDALDTAGSGIFGLFGGGRNPEHSSAIASVVHPLDLEATELLGSTTVHLELVPAAAEPRWSPTAWLAGAWLTGTVLVLAWLAVGLGLRWALSRKARVVRFGPWVDSARRVAGQLGIRREVVLLRGEEDAVPMTWGSLRPVVYLPPGADEWSTEQLHSVLLHELAHVSRWDSLTRSISQLACAIFWFHPLAWYGAHRLLREQERACDDVVLMAGAEPDEYATTLLTLARHYRRRRPAVVGALALARRTTLENRLVSILDPRRKRITMSRTHRFVLLATFVAVAVPLASLQPAPAAPATLSSPSSVAVDGGTSTSTSGQQGESTADEAAATAPVQLIIKGEVHIAATLEEIEVGPGGRFVLQEIESVDDHLEIDSADPGRGRRLVISADEDGNVDRTWTVDGVTSRLDDAARDWVDGVLGRLDDAHVELEPVGSSESRTLIFAGSSLALVGEAHTSAGASSHGVLAIGEDDSVIHLKPGMIWRTREGEEGKTIELRLAKPYASEEGTTIDLELAEPIEVGEVGAWTIHIDEPEIHLHKVEEGDSVVVELKELEGGESFTIVSPGLEVVGEGDDRRIVVMVPKGDHGDQEISAVLVNPKVKIVEEAGEAHAYVVVSPRIVAEARTHPNIHVEIVEEPHVVVDVRTDQHSEHTITMDIDDDDSHMTVRMRGEVDLGDTIDEIEVGEGGELSIDERDPDGVVRQISVLPGPDGNLIFEFFVDGTERPFDAAARAWLQSVLERIEH
jgi:beta-lactamase regulating signal transducer with metallopeptidase domain